jgi:putative nucleotidyltransferase with HDIG domain
MPRLKLIVIADDKARSNLSQAIPESFVSLVDCLDAASLSSLRGSAVLIDIDLHDVVKVRSIKDNLPVRAVDQCRMLAVDRGSHFCEAQANGLGASDLLKRPLDIRELEKCLARHFRQAKEEPPSSQSSLAREPGGPSIVSAAASLEQMFRGLTSGGPINQQLLEEAGNQVLDAISRTGLTSWLSTVRSYHEGTFQHCLLVTGVITAFGHKTGMRRSDALILTTAGLLHDVGKAEVPLTILDKPGKLTNEEFATMKKHPVIGYEYARLQGALGTDVLKAIRHHHEYIDGSGYPDGLSGQNIDDLTRIMTICDVYGALLEQRAYKAPKTPGEAIRILTAMAQQGKVEPELVSALDRFVVAA